MAGFAPALAGGCTVALPKGGRFSASGFLPDVRRHQVTFFNYVGKPLSYVLATPELADDADNPLVRVFGNEGAEQDVKRFGARFGCVVVDSYGSTEGGATVQRTPTRHAAPWVGGRKAPSWWTPRAVRSALRRVSTTPVGCATPRSASGSSSPRPAPRVRGLLARRRRRARPPAQRLVLDRRPGLPGRGGLHLLRGPRQQLVARGRRELRGRSLARVLERHPDVVLSAVYAVPDPAVGDQVMAALQLRPDACVRPGGVPHLLDAQGDLGTKWAPRFVRVCEELPVTATAKVLVRALRAERWNCADPVWWRPGRDEAEYRVLTGPDVAELEEAVERR